MNHERWRQIDQLLQSALDRRPDERREFLDDACANDEALRREMDSFLAAHEQAGDFLSASAFEDAAKMLAKEQAASGNPMINETSNDKSPNSASTLIAASGQPFQLEPGVTLDNRYLIERELGHGGIGVVFLAQDLKLPGTRVVIKVLLEQVLKRGDRFWFEQKFRDEVTALAQIDHHGVVRALDVGQLPDGRSYLVIQYVAGEPLRGFLPAEGMELPRAARLIQQIAQALTAAHDKGVIHRDLKPENILLQAVDGEEKLKLIDFGLATVRDALVTTGHVTRVAGTTPYMAPEQLHGKPEAASDIYALGVIAYELVTGQRPFNAQSLVELADQQRAGVQSLPCDLRSDLPIAAQEVILKALALEPSSRYARAREFSEAFNQALMTEENGAMSEVSTTLPLTRDQPVPLKSASVISIPHQSPVRSRRWLALAAVLAVTFGGALAWYGWRSGNHAVSSLTPSSQAPAPQARPERTLSYSMLLRKNPKRYPDSQPFLALDGITVEAGDELDFSLSSPRAGYLYVIGESPTPTSGLRSFTLLFPTPFINESSAAVTPGQVIQIPLAFDNEVGVEKYWLVWTERIAPELEAVKHHINPREQGVISDPNEIKPIVQYLDERPVTATEVDKTEAPKQIKLKSRSEALVGLVQLQHR